VPNAHPFFKLILSKLGWKRYYIFLVIVTAQKHLPEICNGPAFHVSLTSSKNHSRVTAVPVPERLNQEDRL
jgi:hypothetical protein